ncbi:MAG TPA: redox-regulated ATPase YchF [Planctomycetaceae bacterium]|jgi:ribosome-binding ATPase YchF (GTP1/OBG family)|nr:redox-regulated ATPase YchF [Planctomycetaceae bacterium]HAA51382.1 redox-regulated ATPase YchF [Planctomycetaceae bacterium]HCK51913.1 redox-regulated ATPase YchF [Planctomycetaceae bacterium]|tara:strand:+ start:1931 stop:2962 length:1032 start_codon:yes stop_codon:yes gene_type:complete
MKTGLVGFQGGGKSTVFELLTATAPDPAKAHTGQVGLAIVADARFDKLVEHYRPGKEVPARIELLDTPGLDRRQQDVNPQRLAVIREAQALVQVVGAFGDIDAVEEVERFSEEMALADLQIVSSRVSRLEVDATKPRPDREELQAELEALKPLAEALETNLNLDGIELTELQEKVCRSFSLLTLKKRLVLINTADSEVDDKIVDALEAAGHHVMVAAVGLELELEALDESDRAEMALELGLSGSCRNELMQAILRTADLITFYTCAEKEVHAWLLRRGSSAVDAADSIHSDLARGFIRAEVTPCDKLLELGGEKEVKAAGLWHVEGKDYVVQDGDELFIRSGV